MNPWDDYIFTDEEPPTVQHQVYDDKQDWPGKLYPPWELELIDADHMREDEQEFEWGQN